MNAEKKNIRFGVVLGYINQFLSIIISLVYVPIMLGTLGKEVYGLYAIVQSLISYLNLTDIGIGTTAVRYNALYIANGDRDGQKKINGMFLSIYSFIAFLCIILGTILYFFIDEIYASYSADSIILIKKMFAIALINLMVTFCFKIYNSIITAYEKYIFSRVLNIVQTIVNPFCLYAVLKLGYGAIGLLIVTALLNFVSCLIQCVFCHKKLSVKFSFKGFEKTLFITIVSFTIFIFLNTLGQQLFTVSDKIVLSLMVSAEAVAAFAVVQQLENYYYSFSNIVTSLYMPRLTKMVTGNKIDTNEMYELFYSIGRIQGFLAVFLFGGILACGKSFIFQWLGHDYDEVYWLLIVVLFPQVFGAAQSLFTQLMQAMNLHKIRAVIGICVAFAKILGSIIFVKIWGLWGCAISYFIFYFIRMFAYNIYYQKKAPFNVSEYWKKLIVFYIPLLVIAVLLALPSFIIELEGYLQIITYAFVYALVYIAIAYILFANSREREEIANIIRRLIKKNNKGMKDKE